MYLNTVGHLVAAFCLCTEGTYTQVSNRVNHLAAYLWLRTEG